MAKFLYAQRPSKHVQRRMVVDACRRLDAIAPLTDYRFVGMGAYEFVDFELMRRELSIVGMDSIEDDAKHRRRYLFNRPFDQITVHFDRASNVLPTLLDPSVLRIVWLDYLDPLDHEVLSDVGTCLRKLLPGSVLLITVRASSKAVYHERRSRLAKDVGPHRIPPGIKDPHLGPGGFADVQRDILAASVPEQLRFRSDGATFEQLFDIRYADSKPMQTWGGILSSPALAQTVAGAFGPLPQLTRAGGTPVDATVPPLTTREVLHLNRQLPCTPGALTGEDIPQDELDAYETLYRWYPNVPAAM